ncbi:MAG: DNA-processing protein DprA [Actinomycetota bacterium]|nr:DNA-processing protein DprA [Actinomycetota bacterium]
MNDRARSAFLFLSLLQARVGSSLVSKLGDLRPEMVLDLDGARLASRIKMTCKAVAAFDELKRGFDAAKIEGRLDERGLRAVTLADAEYPKLLKEMPDSPPALFVDGRLPDGPAVALVGSRKSSVTGNDAARRLGRALAEKGVWVVSGLALGIDAAAHAGAVAGGGPTVGVLGCGIDVVYPKSNRALFEEVRGCGGLVSEYYLGESPLAWRFPARNRIISGLSDYVVVVEAAEKSGALITARHALEAGGDVWAVPGTMNAPECRGSNRLLADGAGVLWDIDEFVAMIAPEKESSGPKTVSQAAIPVGLPESEALVLAGVGFEPTPSDVVAGRSGVSMRELLPALTLLELKGYVSRDAAGAFVRRSAS